jgi:hypothetical protein
VTGQDKVTAATYPMGQAVWLTRRQWERAAEVLDAAASELFATPQLDGLW